jgi:hypothetical protein
MLSRAAGIVLVIVVTGGPARGDPVAGPPSVGQGDPPAPSSRPAAPPPTPARLAPAPRVTAPRVSAARRTGPPRSPGPLRAPANVRFSVVAPTTTSDWLLRVVNEGDVPVRILADARLLAFDVTPRSAPRAVHCELPPAMRPVDDLERAIILPPGHVFRERFEPRLYCFGEAGFDALAPSAIVVARLGPHEVTARVSPELSPVDGVEPVIASEPALRADPIALPDERSPREALAPQLQASDPTLDVPRLKLESPAAIDATSPETVEIPVTLRNESSTPVTVRFRPETLGFDVTTAYRVQRCAWPTLPSAPTRDLFTTVPARGAVELTVMLESYCADPLFDRSGLLAVRPFFETRDASGAALGLRTFDGHLAGSSITFVRMQRGKSTEPLIRPRAQALSSATGTFPFRHGPFEP